MYKLGWATDIHFDHADQKAKDRFIQQVKDAECTSLVITGDIGEGPTARDYLEYIFREVSIPVYYVFGNHDFYRSGIIQVRSKIINSESKFKYYPKPIYLTINPGIVLDENTYLVGHDGWYDTRAGDYRRSNVVMSDFYIIEELKNKYPGNLAEISRVCKRLAKESVDHFKEHLTSELLTKYEKIFIATHVPPFNEAATYRGKPSDRNWAPWFVNTKLGDYLLDLAEDNPKNKFLVLCGHSHGGSTCEITNNLTIITGEAQYGFPKLKMVLST